MNYEEPKMELLMLQVGDVIRTSSLEVTPDPDYNFGTNG